MASKTSGKEQRTLKDTRNTSDKRADAKCTTPSKKIMSGFDRKKSRSSMKKIKVVSLDSNFNFDALLFRFSIVVTLV